MTHPQYHEDGAFLVEMLVIRQRYLKMSDRAVARATGISYHTLSKYRNKLVQPTLRVAMAWADALGLSIGIRDRP